MSAITGIFYRDGRKVDPELIKKMNDRLSHRGPDGSAIWCEGSVALGHQMLWTTPESLHEKLPFEESGLVITADARIDNRKELSEELGVEDKEDVSDSYFILKAYEKWGEKCPEYLLGDFAFAIWDENEEKLFCARDHMGVKPFYYYLDEEMFVFGTEIKALFCVPGVPRELNELKIAFHLVNNIMDKKLTFYNNIIRLTAANSLSIDQIGLNIKKYWELDPKLQIKMSSDDEYILLFRELFEEAVNCRLRSSLPMGFELSGGLDSSSIVCMAKKILTKIPDFNNLDTFSYVFNDIPQVDERPYIKKVIDSGGIRNNFIFGDNINLMKNMEDIIWYQEQPSYNPYMSIIWDLYKLMQKKSIRVILSGNGGDETISHGKYYIKELAVTLNLKKMIRELNSHSKRTNQSFIISLINEVIFPLIPIKIKKILLQKRGVGRKRFILNKEYAKRYGGEEYLEKSILNSIETVNMARSYHYFLLNNISLQSHMEEIDKISSAFSIEPRYPFFDKRLVEFCFAIPDEMKFRFGWDRYLHRVALENILPKEIRWRSSKMNFAPIAQKKLLFEKKYLEKIFHDKNVLSHYVDIDTLRNIYKNFIYGNEYKGLVYLWLAMILYFWLKKNEMFSVDHNLTRN